MVLHLRQSLDEWPDPFMIRLWVNWPAGAPSMSTQIGFFPVDLREHECPKEMIKPSSIWCQLKMMKSVLTIKSTCSKGTKEVSEPSIFSPSFLELDKPFLPTVHHVFTHSMDITDGDGVEIGMIGFARGHFLQKWETSRMSRVIYCCSWCCSVLKWSV